jgi:hypothetical protein
MADITSAGPAQAALTLFENIGDAAVVGAVIDIFCGRGREPAGAGEPGAGAIAQTLLPLRPGIVTA